MGCELVSGLAGVCAYSASGVERLWVANKSEISGLTYNSGGELTGVSFTTTGGTFYEIVPALDSATFQDDLAINGSRRNFLQTVNFGVASLSASTLQTLETIGLANLAAIVKTAEGDFRALGIKGAGLRTTVMTETSGTQAGNDSAIQVTLAGNASGKASYVSAALINSLGIL
jgi:hypothetical protein